MVLRRVVVTGLGALHPLEITLKNIGTLINGSGVHQSLILMLKI
jgi:hypothetical protein